ncbi:hypothetical protein INS49_003491 [Diaporthe citri]|uniref:uncharacterized protein n=1 Tax=Diaporthe citri TaxID=83186 RepID=UPI001C80C582|nr:uncharacterized protein INS49_003491 [Diaporthe citri]KAG6355529.1 hypothetical protein INS49_003491 [Diaporthe citri]
MSQCVSCNNQPNDNDSLGGGAHEGAVTPMVVGIIAGTVVVFVLVLCALFYCAKLENDKTRRGLKAEEEDDGAVEEGGSHPTSQQLQPSPSPTIDDEGVEILDGDGDDDDEFGRHHRPRPREPDVKSRPVERRPSSVTVVAGEVEDACGGGSADTTRPAGGGGVKKKGLFSWGGGKKSSGRATPADNPPVTAIEMV